MTKLGEKDYVVIGGILVLSLLAVGILVMLGVVR